MHYLLDNLCENISLNPRADSNICFCYQPQQKESGKNEQIVDYPVMPTAELKRFCSVRLTFFFHCLVCGQRLSLNVKLANPRIFTSALKAQKKCILAGIFLLWKVDRISLAWLPLHSAIVPQLKTHIPLLKLIAHWPQTMSMYIYWWL